MIKKLLVVILRLIYFLSVFVLVVFLVLLFGNKILSPGLTGSDNANFITLASWLSKWFPRIPFWFPQEGGGMSFTVSYPILNHLILVVFEKITHFPIAVIFRVWSLITVVLTSIGLYLLSFRLTKNQTISALVAIFYPLMPIVWVFLLMWGFAAEQLSFMFVPPVFIFASLFLDEFYTKGITLKTKIYFLLFVSLFAILPLAHPLIFIGTAIFITFLFLIYPLLNFKSKENSFKKIVFITLASMGVVLLMSLYWIFPFFRYQKAVAQGAPVKREIYNRSAFLQNGIYARSVFNLSDKSVVYKDFDEPIQNVSAWAWRNVTFTFIISMLALVGFIGAFFINRKVFAFGLANLIPLTLSVLPKQMYLLINIPLAHYLLNWRATILSSMFVMPLLAGFGCFSLAYLVTFFLNNFVKKAKTAFLRKAIRMLFVFLSTALTLIIAVFLLWKFKSWPPKNPDFLLSYGPEIGVPSEKIDLRKVWKRERDYCFYGATLSDILGKYSGLCKNHVFQKYFWIPKLEVVCEGIKNEGKDFSGDVALLCGGNPDKEVVMRAVRDCKNKNSKLYSLGICRARNESFWNQVKPQNIEKMLKSKNLLTQGREVFGSERGVLELLPHRSDTRIEIGTSLGAFMMFEPFYSDVPELPVYYNQATLIKTLWNYEISVFNQKDSVWPQDNIMYELSKYFGLEYALISEKLVPLDKYTRTGWSRIKKWGVNDPYEGLALWKFDQPAGLLRATTKPTVLVIGQDKVDGYFRIFHLANLNALSFDDGLIVKGGPYADAYSAEELKNFDAVILEGYTYKRHNLEKGWRELERYIKDGGSLFINTGWQYSSADWQLKETPDFFPLKTLEWNSVGGSEYKDEGSEIIDGVDVNEFGPLVYGKKSWNVSSADTSDLRDWAKVIISANGKPLVAGGKYGKGRVIWTGLDLPGHIASFQDNSEEVKLYKDLLLYLLENKGGRELKTSFVRNYPDKIEISIDEPSNKKTAIYWSEAYYPDFKARLVENGKSRKIKIYKAGPGMTLFLLPRVTAGSKIIYEYKVPLLVLVSKLLSLGMLLVLIVIIVKPSFFDQLRRMITGKLENRKFKIHILNNDEDINY